MQKRSRPVYLALAVMAVVAMLVGMIPALGSHLPNDAGTVHLHLGSDGSRYFLYTPTTGSATQQDIGSPIRCQLSIAGSVATVTGNRNGPGLSDDGIGIKSGGAQGTPCGQVDSTENLTVALAAGIPLAEQVDLDLELKGDAKVNITVYAGTSVMGTFQVRSGASIVNGEGVDGNTGDPYTATATTDDPGTLVNESIANCKNASDSGPDAGSRDNCRLTIDSALPFNRVKFEPVVGAMSLEGSGDFGNDVAKDTIFYLTSFEGVLGCGDSTLPEADGGTSATITRHQNIDDPATSVDESQFACTPKAYSLKAVDSPTGEDTVTFELGDSSQVALYRADITFTRPVDGLFNA
ncbi:MAG: hypothetical protein WB239_04040, partial [Acidimicrobiia bacterium]